MTLHQLSSTMQVPLRWSGLFESGAIQLSSKLSLLIARHKVLGLRGFDSHTRTRQARPHSIQDQDEVEIRSNSDMIARTVLRPCNHPERDPKFPIATTRLQGYPQDILGQFQKITQKTHSKQLAKRTKRKGLGAESTGRCSHSRLTEALGPVSYIMMTSWTTCPATRLAKVTEACG